MTKRLWVRISIAFSLITIFTTLVVLCVLFLSLRETGFIRERILENQYENEALGAYITAYYEENGSLKGVFEEVISRFWQDRLLDDIIWLLITVIGVGSLSGVISGILVSRNMTRPLNQIMSVARHIQQGDYQQILPQQGSIEIRTMTNALNEMMNAIHHAETLRRHLLADVAHELRTPLSVLQSNLYAILDDMRPLDKAQIAHLYDETRLLGRLVTDLHDLAQAEAGELALHRTPTDIRAILDDILTTFEVMANNKEILLSATYPPELPLLLLDSGRIRQVFYNLVHNAIRHTAQGGHIRIYVQVQAESLVMTIADDGEGISSDHLPHIFDRFYRVDSARDRATGGSGLGLAIARGIIHEHDGTIRATSAGVGMGTTFTISLPQNSL